MIRNWEQALPNHFELPQRIRKLSDLAYNLWWTWEPGAGRLFKDIDPVIWEATYHNPVVFLRQVERGRLNRASRRRNYLEAYDRLTLAFEDYMQAEDTWYDRTYPDRLNQPIAYFSTEFGLHEALPIYAGGLGVLSGDHLKEASDLGMPLVAVGFLYTEGYFKQHITEDGWQEAEWSSLSFPDLPAYPVLDANGTPILVSVLLPGRELHSRLWRVQVGRVPLFLLDSNVSQNQPNDRSLTARLYTSDHELRIAQEMILGIGGVRALRELGYNPAVWHLNEGHSAFQTLERARELTAGGLTFEQARERIRATTIFTTHTPVPAGHDEFQPSLIEKFFGQYWPQLGLDRETFLDLACEKHDWGETFSMSRLAIRMASHLNGVSELHGEVAREMWSHIWPSLPAEETPTWLARRLSLLFNQYLDQDWRERLDDPSVWEGVDRIPDNELWSVRHHLKRKLVAFMRERVRAPWVEGGTHPVQVIASGVLLDPYALTIGFARRFATYKRAQLILSQPDRLLELINQPERPVQIIFAGKAHPNDEPGKRLIQDVYRVVKKAEFAGRLVFLEDYDLNVARYMVQGVDVWLNTPRRPNEASGTSGQKAALNGVLNFSVLDGWWREGYSGTNGWAIGEDKTYDDPQEQDRLDAESLYDVLENQIIPLYHDRTADNLPVEWLGWVRESIRTLAPAFSMRRMVKEYMDEMYLTALPDPNEV
jgi:starch phosphorylase